MKTPPTTPLPKDSTVSDMEPLGVVLPRLVSSSSQAVDVRKLKRRARKAAGATLETIVTCPASRHVEQMAADLSAGETYPMFTDDPLHCAASMYSVLESLWRARAKIKLLTANVSNQIPPPRA